MYDIIAMKSIAKQLNDFTFTDYFYRLSLIARSIFKWENLPNGISEKWVERYLFNDGKCLFYKDPTRGFMVAKCAESGSLNYYDEATLLTPYGTNYMGEALQNDEECVVVQNNDLQLPTSPTIQLFAYRLADVQRTIDVNISAQKTPVIVLCGEKQKLSIKRAMQQVNDNEVAIFGDKTLDVDNVKALRLDAPIVFDKLYTQKQNIWNECMLYLGINNNPQEAKRERLVVNEVEANNKQIETSAEVFLKSRQEACEKINKLFGLNINVSMRQMEAPEAPEYHEQKERDAE